MKILNVVGARPNFMKIAPIIEAMDRVSGKFEDYLVHTGQHYDKELSSAFFDDLSMAKPDINLEVGSASHAVQTAEIMVKFEKVCIEINPDLVIVVGDVNSTMACAITAKKLGILVAHVEAGLRSKDMSMPEEINRLCTDAVCDYLFTTDRFANENLIAEGVPREKIIFVGNVMIDTLLKQRKRAEKLTILEDLSLKKGGYATLTMHRPSNVDDEKTLRKILGALNQIGRHLPIIFPIHPRTKSMIEKFGLMDQMLNLTKKNGIKLMHPLGYLEMLKLNMHARMVITDSGGLQEETTVLGVPCITMRQNTERPITCVEGTNILVGNDPDKIVASALKAFKTRQVKNKIPEKWDGNAAGRIIDWLLQNKQMILKVNYFLKFTLFIYFREGNRPL